MTRIYLSSLEVQPYQKIPLELIYQSDYLLMSYFYLRTVIKDPLMQKIVCHYNKNNKLIIDSGTFSYLKGAKATVSSLDSYCQEYADFVAKYQINQYVELDVDALVGYSRVLEYRKLLESKRGKKCIPIWHKPRGKQEFIKEVKEYDYIGLGGIAIGKITKSDWHYFSQLNAYAKKHHCKIHAMGFTPAKNINEYGFYSSDSSSWTGGARFGTIYYFNGRQLKQIKKPPHTRVNRSNVQLDKINYQAWCDYQHYVGKKG